jgi:hypothetical protein
MFPAGSARFRATILRSSRSRADTTAPKEHQQHLELAANYPKVNMAYTKVVTISTDVHHSSQEFRNSVGAPWPLLSDPEWTVQNGRRKHKGVVRTEHGALMRVFRSIGTPAWRQDLQAAPLEMSGTATRRRSL